MAETGQAKAPRQACALPLCKHWQRLLWLSPGEEGEWAWRRNGRMMGSDDVQSPKGHGVDLGMYSV